MGESRSREEVMLGGTFYKPPGPLQFDGISVGERGPCKSLGARDFTYQCTLRVNIFLAHLPI